MMKLVTTASSYWHRSCSAIFVWGCIAELHMTRLKQLLWIWGACTTAVHNTLHPSAATMSSQHVGSMCMPQRPVICATNWWYSLKLQLQHWSRHGKHMCCTADPSVTGLHTYTPHHHHHHITHSSHSISAIGPAPHRGGKRREHCSRMFACIAHIPRLDKKSSNTR
ncbi:hypothetical protein COO60DRAFT_381221 [Scenedesmus sp. NREL 46B-D3]|nr:hypothetical protein COO60DRAFT_381221 [Scenedesmus sp. NREL 46B-D3]